ncbi:MAG: Ig-like domain-containing protein [Lachnospiraceae bacterium]|nr:Ig-like domain-containing protein [Lachnospiraceae bacterium]
MKTLRRSSLLLVFCFVVSLFSPVSAEAAVLKMNKAKAILEVDATLKLKLGSLEGTESKWSSSDKKVASVSKTGTVTAKSEGTATITATYDSKKYTCKVTVVDSNKEDSSESKTVLTPTAAATPTAAPKPTKTPAPTVTPKPTPIPEAKNTTTYILNISSKIFHKTWCSSVKLMKDSNKRSLESTYAEMVSKGYSPCKKCFQ